jgi:oxalate decarboxylase/phosphoglucose isomerase-like protein (cupin superfamily)
MRCWISATALLTGDGSCIASGSRIFRSAAVRTTLSAGAGDILVIKAGEVHSFKNIGDTPLVQLDVHLSPQFIQENLG